MVCSSRDLGISGRDSGLEGGLGGVPGKGSGVVPGGVGEGSVNGGGFFGQGGCGTAMGDMRFFGPTGRDQTCTPQGEPTFRKGGGAQGGGKGVGFRELDLVGSGLRELPGRGLVWMRLGGCGVQDPLLVGHVLSQRTRHLMR